MQIEEARSFLRVWGSCTRKGGNPGISWNPVGVLHRIIKLGPVGASIRSSPGIQTDPPEVARVDEIFHKIPLNYQRCLWLYYVDRKKLVRASKIMEISREKFRQSLHRAEERVAGCLSIEE